MKIRRILAKLVIKYCLPLTDNRVINKEIAQAELAIKKAIKEALLEKREALIKILERLCSTRHTLSLCPEIADEVIKVIEDELTP